MRIGEVAARSGLSRDTIRFYERNGLINSTKGNERTNSYRTYDAEVVARLEMVREAQNAGFTIAELKMFLRQLEYADGNTFDADAFLQNKIAEVEHKIERAQLFLGTLRATQQALANKVKK